MNRPSPFEIMRRRRKELERAAEACACEQAWDRHCDQIRQERAAEFKDTSDWMSDTREQARAKVAGRPLLEDEFFRPVPRQPSRPGLLKRAWNYAFGFGGNA